MPRPPFSATILFFFATAAATQSCSSVSTTPASALTIVETLAVRQPQLTALIAPRTGAFQRAPDANREDGETRGQLVSEGWRSTAQKRFGDLGARAPDLADGMCSIGVSRFASMHIGVSLIGAHPSTASLREGRILYPNVFAGTDRILTANDVAFEEFLVLRGPEAPTRFAWHVRLGADITTVHAENGGLVFASRDEKPIVVVAPPRAWDSLGDDLPTHLEWDQQANTMRLSLDVAPEHWPVVVDPRYETSHWFDADRFLPGSRTAHAMVYDAVRREMVTFGGSATNAFLDETWVWNGQSWTKRRPLSSPSSRTNPRLTFDAARGEAVLFGGLEVGTFKSDTWTWNGATWTKKSPVTTPPARALHALTFDSVRNEVVMFGGSGVGSDRADTWVWNGVDWAERIVAESPPARANHAMAFDAIRGESVLFGGVLANGTRAADTWTWNGTTWLQKNPVSSPVARSSHAVAFDPVRQTVVMFGGRGATVSTLYNDFWSWNGTNWAPLASGPPARNGHALEFDVERGQLVLFAGTSGGVAFRDTWTWDGITWAQRAPTATPAARSHSTLSYDAARNEVLLFGGVYASTYLNDTWVWNGARWTARSPSASPPVRAQHATVYDTARAKILLFGGVNNGSSLGDTWAWNGTTWAQESPATPPSPRFSHSMAYDEARAQVVLYGGMPTGLDTYIWDGAQWARRTPLESPGARFGSTLVYDAARTETLLFGGTLFAYFQDTWAWDGTTWAKRLPRTSPTARAYTAMAYDPSRAQVLLYGGVDASGSPLGDVWAWDGAAWFARSPATPPITRVNAAVTFDSARNNLVLFGGAAASAPLGDTWLYTTLGGACANDSDCFDASCVDGVCCNTNQCDACETCGGTSPGRCTPVLNTEDPDTCAIRDGKSCGPVGECSGALGVTATKPADCASGFLVDGVCCFDRCEGTCQACRADLKETGDRSGFCGPAQDGTDTHDSCPQEAQGTCGRNGACDGAGACKLHVIGTACGPASCLGTRSSSRICDGLGTCSASTQGVDCAQYACTEERGCNLACQDTIDCAPLHHCEMNTCVADRGAVCDGEHTVTSPTGQRVDCGDYKCEGATCKTSCARRTDCVGTADCSLERECIPFASNAEQNEPTGCHAHGGTHRANAAWLIAIGAMLVARTQKRRLTRGTGERPDTVL